MTSHPFDATTTRDLCCRRHPRPCPCLRHLSTLRVDVAHRRCILPPPPPRMIIVVFVVPVPVPATCQCRASTSHAPAATATRNLCRRHRPRPCPRRLLTSRIDIALPHRHCLARSLLSSSSPLPVDVNVDIASSCRHCHARSLLLSSPPPVNVDAKVASSRRRHRLARWLSSLSLSLSSSLPPADVDIAS